MPKKHFDLPTYSFILSSREKTRLGLRTSARRVAQKEIPILKYKMPFIEAIDDAPKQPPKVENPKQKRLRYEHLTELLIQHNQIKAKKLESDVLALNETLNDIPAGSTLVIDDLDNEVYHQSDGISSSKIKYLIASCGENYKAKYVSNLIKEKEKEYFNIGNAIETLLLEPHKFEGMFVCQPASITNRNSLDYRIFKAEAECNNLTVLSYDVWNELLYFKQKCETEKRLQILINSNGISQRSIFKRDKETNMLIKCRLDFVIGNVGIDIKSSTSALPRWFNLQAKKLGYAIQDAMYSDIANLSEFHFITIESSLPFALTFDSIFDSEMKELGYHQYRCGLMEIKASEHFDNWETYTKDTNIIKATQYDLAALDVYKQRHVELANIVKGMK